MIIMLEKSIGVKHILDATLRNRFTMSAQKSNVKFE